LNKALGHAEFRPPAQNLARARKAGLTAAVSRLRPASGPRRQTFSFPVLTAACNLHLRRPPTASLDFNPVVSLAFNQEVSLGSNPVVSLAFNQAARAQVPKAPHAARCFLVQANIMATRIIKRTGTEQGIQGDSGEVHGRGPVRLFHECDQGQERLAR